MAWDPVFSSDGRVAAQVELDGKRTVALDGKLSSHSFDRLWQPRFSPDGKQLLLRGVRGTTVHRLVVACDRFNVRPSAAARA